MNKYVVEFIGTFFLVLTIGCTVITMVAVASFRRSRSARPSW